MLRTLSIVSALAVTIATPAFAETAVTLNLKGKSPDAIAAEVAKAASYVCRDVMPAPNALTARRDCIKATIAVTNAKIAKIYASTPTATLASR